MQRVILMSGQISNGKRPEEGKEFPNFPLPQIPRAALKPALLFVYSTKSITVEKVRFVVKQCASLNLHAPRW